MTTICSIFLTIPSGAGCFFSINNIYWKFKDAETVSIHQVSDFTQRKPFGRIVTAVFNIKSYNFRDLGRFQVSSFLKKKGRVVMKEVLIPSTMETAKQSPRWVSAPLAVASIAFRWTHILPTDGKGMCDLLNHLQTGSDTFMTRTSLIFYWQPWRSNVSLITSPSSIRFQIQSLA